MNKLCIYVVFENLNLIYWFQKLWQAAAMSNERRDSIKREFGQEEGETRNEFHCKLKLTAN